MLRAGTDELGYACLCHYSVNELIEVMPSSLLSSNTRVVIRRGWSTNSPKILYIDSFIYLFMRMMIWNRIENDRLGTREESY